MLASPKAAAAALTLAVAACGGGGGGSSSTGALTCADYCATMTSTCVGGDTQYVGLIPSCESYCAANAWPTGTSGDAIGNTLACRITHAGLAAASEVGSQARTMHCGHAGPSGLNVCGTWCDNYCYLALRNCTGANGAGLGFTDLASCRTACAGFASNGAIDAPTGNTVQCRIYHAGAAAEDPAGQCGAAQVVSSATPGGTAANGACN